MGLVTANGKADTLRKSDTDSEVFDQDRLLANAKDGSKFSSTNR